MGKHFILAFIFLFAVGNLLAQAPQKRLDSLLLVNKNYLKQDSVKVLKLEGVYRQYLRLKNIEKAEQFADETIDLAQKLSLYNLAAMAYYRKALFYHGSSNYRKALENYEIALTKFSLANNQDMVAGTYLNMGAMYISIPDYAKSLEMNQKAIAIYLKMNNDADLASCYANISEIYKDIKQHSKALDYLQKALKIFIANGESERGVAVVYNGIAGAYLNAANTELVKMGIIPEQKFSLALTNLHKALKVAEIIKDDGVSASIYLNLGKTYEGILQNDMALASYQKALAFSKGDDDQNLSASVLQSLSDFYFKTGDEQKALEFSKNALKIATDNELLDEQKNALYSLSLIYEKLNLFDQALNYYRKYVEVSQQIFDEEKEKEITRKQLQIDFAIKEKNYQIKQNLTSAELQKQVLLAEQQQQQLILRKQELALSDKEKSLQRLTFLKKQADLENEQKLQNYNFQKKQLESRYITSLRDKQISKQKQQIAYDQKIKISLIVSVLLLLCIAFLIYYNQRKTSKLNQIISTQKKELEHLGNVKDRIFSIVSHDMRTPVNALISFIQLLENGNISPEKLYSYAEKLKSQLTHTSALMENLLNWAGSQMQGFVPIIETVNLSEVTDEIINILYPQLLNKNIKISKDFSEKLSVKTDHNMLALILRNLMSNAIKYTPNAGEIILSANINDYYVELHIGDNGIGLTPLQIEKINSKDYFLAEKSRPGTNNEKGTGLGLLLCRSFMAILNGNITALEAKEKGSTFIVKLPA
ncbi:tetratricopeptide repeat protein [Pedobacter nototheniae]|uniref:tetratricopeptide repeat-containing sensor histidine kinase n=1 Tax=Pedobacter nototheniae TaxID=2488994 RepID=UPI0029300AB4|nr:tetratricopeptide repeat protein [Pedobacter nototheniae]